jgi:hypothetical protein
MANIDEDLSQLERTMRVLKIEYEQYFGGGRPRPPSDTQWRCDQLIKRYADRTAEISFAQRFRYNNLSQTYAKYKDIWGKRLRQKEEGVVQRHFGAAARAIEAERARNAPAPVEAPSRAALVERPGGYVVSCSDPDSEKQKVEELFHVLFEAKQKAGEKVDSLSLETFSTFVRQKTAQLKKQNNCDEVEYAIQVEGGQVKFKARVKA